MVVSSPDRRVREAVRKHAGEELAEYKRMAVESAKAIAGGAQSTLAPEQARERRGGWDTAWLGMAFGSWKAAC